MAQQQQQKPGEKSMSASSPSEAPPTAATSSRVGAAQESGWARPPSRMQQILWSGDRRAVFIGVLSVFALSSIPWLYFTRSMFFPPLSLSSISSFSSSLLDMLTYIMQLGVCEKQKKIWFRKLREPSLHGSTSSLTPSPTFFTFLC